MMNGWIRLGTPVVFVVHYNRNILLEFHAAVDTLLNTCGSIPDTTQKVLETIFGR